MPSRPMIVGIPALNRDLKPIGLPPAHLMVQHYTVALAEAGIAAFLIPLYEDETLLRALYERLDGLFLAGGSDLDPKLYGESPHPQLGEIDQVRDHGEMELIRWAFEDHLPVLAVCRGVQVLNVAAGGTLFQDINAQVPNSLDHDYGQYHAPRDHIVHEVAVLPDTRLRRAMGVGQAPVNSLHHQAIRDVAPGFRVNARATDGVIEGIESRNGQFVVGVQWHPEALVKQDPMLGIFEGFAEAIEGNR